MSVRFTDINEGGSAQDGKIANEIIQSYNEHLDVLGGPGIWPRIELVGDGTDAQDRTDWNVIQWFIEYNAHEFINHVDGPLKADESGFLFYTKPSWRAAAGLNAGGFQRSANGVDMFYSEAQGTGGNIFVGDVRGPWCFTDLQKGLSVLRHTPKTYANHSYETKSSSGDAGNGNGRPVCIADWAAQSWIPDTGYTQYYAEASFSKYHYWDGSWGRWNANRSRAKNIISFAAGLPGRVLDVYMVGSKLGASAYAYWDFDSTGIVQGKYGEYLLDVSASGTEYISDWLGDIDVCPADASLFPDPASTAYKFPNFIGSQLYAAKWNFTYQND